MVSLHSPWSVEDWDSDTSDDGHLATILIHRVRKSVIIFWGEEAEFELIGLQLINGGDWDELFDRVFDNWPLKGWRTGVNSEEGNEAGLAGARELTCKVAAEADIEVHTLVCEAIHSISVLNCLVLNVKLHSRKSLVFEVNFGIEPILMVEVSNFLP